MAKGTAAKPVSQSLASLEKELKALRLQVRQVENGLSLNKVINVSILVGLCWGLALGAEGFYQSRRAYNALLDKLPFVDGPNDQATATAPAELDLTPVKRGDKVAGFTVTSTFREPQRPNHNGVDVGGPVGTPYFAPDTVTVRCYWDRSGGGYVAEFQYRELLWQLLHLKAGTCKNGTQSPGAVIGEMGNTGRSTGPHLHLQLRNPDSTFIEPKRGHLLAVLQPPAPNSGTAINGDATEQAVTLIKQFEGFHPSPYWDYQQHSWGYGTRAPGPNGTITREQAERDLRAYLDRNCWPLIPANIQAHQRAALASLCYNIGPAQFGRSDALRHATAGNHAQAAAGFDRWTKAGGKRLQGLVNRRAREKAVYEGRG
jgi:lysozyme